LNLRRAVVSLGITGFIATAMISPALASGSGSNAAARPNPVVGAHPAPPAAPHPAPRPASPSQAATKAAVAKWAAAHRAQQEAKAAPKVVNAGPQLDQLDGVRAAGVQVTGKLYRGAHEVFGQNQPTLDVLEKLVDAPAGYRSKLVSIHADDEEVVFNWEIRDPSGKLILQEEKNAESVVTRSFQKVDGELVVKHDIFKLHKDYQGQGIGEQVIRSSIRGYQAIGVKRIELSAAYVGRYTWARFGFTWNAKAAEERVATFQKYLEKKVGLSPQAAKKHSTVAEKAYNLAVFEIDGKPIGKDFLLDDEYTKPWNGSMELHPSSEGFRVAQARLKL
jgi:GNAT superfamily N-acetyltransferase